MSQSRTQFNLDCIDYPTPSSTRFTSHAPSCTWNSSGTVPTAGFISSIDGRSEEDSVQSIKSRSIKAVRREQSVTFKDFKVAFGVVCVECKDHTNELHLDQVSRCYIQAWEQQSKRGFASLSLHMNSWGIRCNRNWSKTISFPSENHQKQRRNWVDYR